MDSGGFREKCYVLEESVLLLLSGMISQTIRLSEVVDELWDVKTRSCEETATSALGGCF